MIYTEDGEFEEYRFFPRNPDLVLVDSQVVANAPVDLLVAGVGDALAGGLAAAHAVHNGLTAVAATHGLAHGQKVKIGSVTQP